MNNKNLNGERLVLVIYLVSNILISILLLSLTVSIVNSLRDADKQRTKASQERQETICILKIQPQDRTLERINSCKQ